MRTCCAAVVGGVALACPVPLLARDPFEPETRFPPTLIVRHGTVWIPDGTHIETLTMHKGTTVYCGKDCCIEEMYWYGGTYIEDTDPVNPFKITDDSDIYVPPACSRHLDYAVHIAATPR